MYPSTPITTETAEMLLSRLEVPQEPEPTAIRNGSKGRFDVVSFLNANDVRIANQEPHQGGVKYVLAECIFDPGHKAPDAAVIARADGKIGYHCFHASCAEKTWRDARQRLDPSGHNRPSPAAMSQIGASRTVEYQSLSLAELKNVPDPNYLIDGILDTSQPGVIAGQYKSLKTTIAVEMALALTTGEPFLGRFPITKIARVGIFSGETGPAQLRDLVRRVALFHGEKDPWQNERLVLSCRELPKIGIQQYMDALARWIEKHKLDLVIIDPAYAALAEIGNSAGNYYKVADLLFQVTQLQRQTGCVVLLCPHMTKAPKYDPPMLSDIQWSGFSEWAGQWLLLGKRREWDDSKGQHWLWLVAGGRSGHASTLGLNVREGRQDDQAGKVFEVDVLTKEDAISDRQRATMAEREKAAEAEKTEHVRLICDAFTSLGDGWQIKTQVLTETGRSPRGKALLEAWDEMLKEGQIEEKENACKGGNNKPCHGYQLVKQA